MKIMVAAPLHRPVDLPTFGSFVHLASYRGEHEYTFTFVQNSLVYDARESIAQAFLQSDNEALMMIDSDMTFPYNAVERLVAHNQPFVTAKAFKRVYPYQPCFYTKVDIVDGKPELQVPLEYPPNCLLNIEGCGMAAVLIRREVFENIEAPYFFPQAGGGLGEDLSFCYKLKQAGVPMYVDTTLEFGHLGVFPFGEKEFKAIYDAKKAAGEPYQA